MEADDREYVGLNLANWDSRVPHHAIGYGLDRYRGNPSFLSDVVRFDLPRLPVLTGLDVVHLQCHIGTDTLSLARLGARSVTGLDFSAPALEVASSLARDTGADVRYVRAEVYDAVDALGPASFDLVFTGIGALCWLPDVRRWADVVARLLRPGGRLFIREGHPVLWTMSDPRDDGLLVVQYPYFETTTGTVFHEETTYVPHEGTLDSPTTRQWNHGLGEIITALLDAGMDLTSLEEHASVPWNPLGTLMVQSDEHGGEFVLRSERERLPMTYTLQAVRR